MTSADRAKQVIDSFSDSQITSGVVRRLMIQHVQAAIDAAVAEENARCAGIAQAHGDVGLPIANEIRLSLPPLS